MKKKILIAAITLIGAVCLASGLAACDFSGNGENNKKEDVKVTYHLNGGYFLGDKEETAEFTVYLKPEEISSFKPMQANRDTWILENWYTDENCDEEFDSSSFIQIANSNKSVDLYAKWIDEITVTKENFTEFFSVTSRWNGGGTVGNAGISFSFKPKFAIDPDLSAESVSINATPVLSNNGSIVWSGKTKPVSLDGDKDYYYEAVSAIDSSAAGIQFDITGETLKWELVTKSFKIKLLHGNVLVTLNADGAKLESYEISVAAGDKLLKTDLPTPVKNGYKFMGWFTDGEFTEEFTDKLINSNRTLHAKFLKQITVTFHTDGGEEIAPLTFLQGEFMNINDTPTKENYKFFGWYTSKIFDDENKFSTQYAGENDVELYARWEKLHTVTFETNGGESKQPIKVANTETPNLGADPVKTGRVFQGWFTDAACTNKYVKGPISADITLYALWVQEINLNNATVEQLKQYADINITHEKVTLSQSGVNKNYLKVTLSASIKEEYRRYGFMLYGSWRIEFSNEEGDNLGNKITTKTLSTLNDKLSFSEEFLIESGYASYNATVFDLNIDSQSAFVYVPESAQ